MTALAEQEQAISTEAYEGFLRFVLSTTEVCGDNALADWINTQPRPTAKERVSMFWRSRCHGNYLHATSTRAKAGSSIPLERLDYEKSPYVHAINALPAPYPDQIRGAFSENSTIEQIQMVAYPVIRTYRKADAMQTAADMLQYLMRPSQKKDPMTGKTIKKPPIWEYYGYEREEWNDTDLRKAWDRVRRKMRDELRPAVQAWVYECESRGLEL